jgi:hypothetical protein
MSRLYKQYKEQKELINDLLEQVSAEVKTNYKLSDENNQNYQRWIQALDWCYLADKQLDNLRKELKRRGLTLKEINEIQVK